MTLPMRTGVNLLLYYQMASICCDQSVYQTWSSSLHSLQRQTWNLKISKCRAD